MSAKTTGASATPNGTTHRTHHDGSSTRAFTPEQKTAVTRIRACSPTAFYDILGLESEKTTVTDAGIKKAYRKLSLLTHPDKNGYTGADEAFKLVSRAFQVLSDPEKKKRFDVTGGDPDSRFSGASAGASPFSGFASRSQGGGTPFGFNAQRGGSMFEEEISPEELFRQFFGGGGFGGGPFGMGGPMFGGGPFGGSSFVFNGPGGVRVHQFGGNRPRRRPPGTGGQEEQPTAGMALLNLLPVIFIFIILPLLSSILGSGGGGTWGTSQFRPPPYSLDTPNHNRHLSTSRISTKLKVEYFYNPKDVEQYNPKQWAQLDETAEARLMYVLENQCHAETLTQQQLWQDSQGWFSIDREKESQARNMEKPGCERFQRLRRKGRSWM